MSANAWGGVFAAILAALVLGAVFSAKMCSSAPPILANIPPPPPPDAIRRRKIENGYVLENVTMDVCRATIEKTIRDLGVGHRKVRRIVDSRDVVMTRLCMDDGKSVLVTCSRVDLELMMQETAGGPEVGCP